VNGFTLVDDVIESLPNHHPVHRNHAPIGGFDGELT